MNIQSNVIKGDFKKDIIGRTLNEIYSTMSKVYGPYGTDIFIKNEGTYYTRDGKEVMASISFDNSLARDLLGILYQALEHQARIAGDGTTSLVLLYINIYRQISAILEQQKVSTSLFRRAYNKAVSDMIEVLRKDTVEMTDELFKSMLFTCTQDPELSEKIYRNIKDDLKGNAHVIINKSDYIDEFEVIRHNQPLIECTKMYSFFNVDDVFEVNNARVIYCDGVLDIANEDTFNALLTIPLNQTVDASGEAAFVSTDIVILCDGITEATRNTLKRFRSSMFNANKEQYNNIIIMRTHINTKEEKLDMCSFVYNIDELTGITHSMTFESYIYQTLVSDIETIKQQYIDKGEDIPAYLLFDASQTNKDRLVYALTTCRNLKYNITEGLLIDSPLTEISMARYNELTHLITSEKSHVKRLQYTERLKKIYGVFIEINVGSELMKDSQRKLELIKDAIVSAQRGFNDGVIMDNSLWKAYELLADDLMEFEDNEYSDIIKTILENAIRDTIAVNYTNANIDGVINDDNRNLHNKESYTINGVEINTQITEPFPIIENLLKNSTLAIDLALSDVYIVENFMHNFI